MNQSVKACYIKVKRIKGGQAVEGFFWSGRKYVKPQVTKGNSLILMGYEYLSEVYKAQM